MSKKVTILVTGSSGQVGLALQAYAEQISEWDFIFTDRDTLDITDSSSINLFFEKNSIDFCINCAAYTKVDQAEKESYTAFLINEQGTGYLAEICKKHHTILIHLSTDYVYHPDHDLVNLESDACHPKGVYALSKYRGEQKIIETGALAVIIRTSWVYSAHGHNFVRTMLNLGQQKNKISVVHDQVGSPTYAPDLARAILKIISACLTSENAGQFSGIYNFSNAGFTNWAAFALEIFRISHMDIMVQGIPTSEYPTPAQRPLNSRLSKSKITSTFNIHLVPWQQSLEKCLKEIHNSLG